MELKDFFREIRNKVLGTNYVTNKLSKDIAHLVEQLKKGQQESALQVSKDVAQKLEQLEKNHQANTLRLETRIKDLTFEISSLNRRRFQSKHPATILFLVHNGEAWPALEEIFLRMKSDPNFEPVVATIPRRYPGAREFEKEDLTHAILTSRGIPHIRFNIDGLSALNNIHTISPDIIFRQSQWENDIWPELSAERLTAFRLCYVPYEVEPFPLEPTYYPDSLRRFFESCWRIFIQPKIREDNLELQDNIFKPLNTRYMGTPKCQYVHNLRNKPKSRRTFTLLWSAHHSIGQQWSNFGTFPKIKGEMIDWAKKEEDIFFIFSPHPALESLGQHGCAELTCAEWAEFLEEWNRLPNTATISGIENDKAFSEADALLIDGISWLLEFQFLQRPVIQIEREDHAPYNKTWRQIMRGVHSFSSIDEAMLKVYAFKNGEPDSRLEQQIENCHLFIREDAAQSIIDEIRTALAVPPHSYLHDNNQA